jgi:ribonuclease T2
MRIALLIAATAALSTPSLGSRAANSYAAYKPITTTSDGKSCAVPADLPKPMLEGPSRDEPRRLLPIGGYTLSVSWSPQYCASRMTSPKDHLQCGGGVGEFGFTLHGLWPDGVAEQWPQYCTPARLVPEAVIRDNLCNTPSVQLIQHEWEKHGTCMGHDPAPFFRKGSGLYRALHFPDMEPFRGKTVAALTFQQAFADANKGLKADQMRLNVGKDGWLQEVWLCLDTAFRYRTCPATQGGAAPAAAVKVR